MVHLHHYIFVEEVIDHLRVQGDFENNFDMPYIRGRSYIGGLYD